MKEQINALQNTLTTKAAQLSAERQRLSGLKLSAQTSEYNQAVPGYNAMVNRYNDDIDSLSGLIAEYNDIVPKRNAVASEESDLAKAIDSRSSVPARQ